MPAKDHLLLNLRGTFQDLTQSTSPVPTSYSIENIINLFPITDDYVMVASRKSVHLLHLPSQEILWSIFTTRSIIAAALAPDQPQLALAFAEETVIWDLSNGQIIQRLTCSLSESEGGELAFGMGRVLAIAPMNGGVQLWNVETGQLLHTLVDAEETYYASPKSLVFSPDGTFLAIGHANGPDVWLWRVAEGQVYQMMDAHPWSQSIYGLAFTPDGRLLIGSEWSTDPEEESMSIWEVSTGKRIDKLPRMAWLPTVSPDGQFAASTANGSIFVWDLDTRSLLWQPMGEREEIMHLLFSSSGRFLISCSSNGTSRWWDMEQRQEVYRLECARSGYVRGALTGDGQRLLTRTVDGVVTVWNTTSGAVSFQIPFSNPFIEGSAFGTAGEQIVLWEDRSGAASPLLYLFYPFLHSYLNFVPIGEQQVECTAYNEESKLLAAGCTDRGADGMNIQLWRVLLDLPITAVTPDVQKANRDQSEPIHHFVGHTKKICCILFSPHGEILASGSDDHTVRLWNTSTREEGFILSGHTQAILCLAFSRDGSQLVSGSKDGTVRVWDVASGQLLHVLEGQMESIISVAVDENGQRIAAVDQNQHIHVWKIQEKVLTSGLEAVSLTLVAHEASSLKGESLPPEQLQEGLHFWTFTSDGSTYQLMQKNTQLLAITFQSDNSIKVSGYCWGMTAIWNLAQIAE